MKWYSIPCRIVGSLICGIIFSVLGLLLGLTFPWRDDNITHHE